MPTVALHAIESSMTLAGPPSAADIATAMRATPMGTRVRGEWVGPAPRVTRVTRTGEPQPYKTHVAWLYRWPDEAWYQTNLATLTDMLRSAVAGQLGTLSDGWGDVEAAAYAEAVNGPLAWWTSGQASVTRTRDQFAELAGRLDPEENPLGQTTPETHPGTVIDLGQGAQQALGALSTLAVVGLVGVGAYLAWPLLTAGRAAAARALPRRNPAGGAASPTAVARRAIEMHASQTACSLRAAARWFVTRYPAESLEAMERLGSWPSSEPALRALQDAFTGQ